MRYRAWTAPRGWTSSTGDRVGVTGALPGGSEVSLENPVDEDGSAAKLLLGLLWSF